MLGHFVRSGERIVPAEQLMLGGARVAAGLESLGIGPGDGVAIYLRNDLAFFEAALGASLVGAYPVAVNWHYTEDEARYVFEDSEAKAVVIHADLLERVRGAIPDRRPRAGRPDATEIAAAYGLDAPAQRGPGRERSTGSSWRDGLRAADAEPDRDDAVDHLHLGRRPAIPRGSSARRTPTTSWSGSRRPGGDLRAWATSRIRSKIVTAIVGPDLPLGAEHARHLLLPRRARTSTLCRGLTPRACSS